MVMSAYDQHAPNYLRAVEVIALANALDPSGLWGKTRGAMEIADCWLDARELVDIADGLHNIRPKHKAPKLVDERSVYYKM